MAAALLTIFVKKSLQTKRIHAGGYELVMPDEAFKLLNADLISANLEAASYITLIYGIYNLAECWLTYARAGHPRPLLIHSAGGLEHLDADGPLLGVFEEADFELRHVNLAAGDRVPFYTDGVENCRVDNLAEMAAFEEVVSRCAHTPLDEALSDILAAIQQSAPQEGLEDDITLVALAAE